MLEQLRFPVVAIYGDEVAVHEDKQWLTVAATPSSSLGGVFIDATATAYEIVSVEASGETVKLPLFGRRGVRLTKIELRSLGVLTLVQIAERLAPVVRAMDFHWEAFATDAGRVNERIRAAKTIEEICGVLREPGE